ncbi:MAG: DUF456 domain-containing protein [Balneolaceae bacterium]
MEIIWIVLGAVFIICGIIGAFLPVVPGLPLSYIGLLCLQLTSPPPFTLRFLVVWALIVLMIQLLEQIATIAGARKMGATGYGIGGSIVGIVLGFFFFPPFGIVFGPIIGAFAGEMIGGKSSDLALRAAMGAVLGFLVSTLLKVMVALVIAYYFVSAVIV